MVQGSQRYAPTPVLIDFTGGSGAYDYTKISPERVASIIGAWDSARALPYLVGSARVLAHAYDDVILSFGSIHLAFLGSILGGTLLVGIAAGIFIPRLPRGVPRRDFGVFSSISVARDALKADDAGDPIATLSLSKIRAKVGEASIQFGVPHQ